MPVKCDIEITDNYKRLPLDVDLIPQLVVASCIEFEPHTDPPIALLFNSDFFLQFHSTYKVVFLLVQ